MIQKKWQVADKITDEFKNRFPQFDDIVLQLLHNRNMDTQEKIDEFLNPDYSTDIHDPYIFKGMEKAVKRVFQAIKNNEKITVHGDYDADGVTGSVVLIKTLEFLGAKNIDIYIPHREKEGYGVNMDTIKYLKGENCNLIITTDCGISNAKEIDLANELEMDVIVTDHHRAPDILPKAIALINAKIPNSKYPYEQLAGVGVAFKLAQALLIKSEIDKQKKESFEKWLLDLVAIGTVADCCPIIGENRTLVKYGLIVLNKTQRLGLRKLIEDSGHDLSGGGKLNTISIGFQIGPKINAAGRLDHANTSFQLLISEDASESARLSASLVGTNRQRQIETENIFKSAKEQAERQKDDYIIFAYDKDWSIGIVGLVAGKLVQEYNRPALVMGQMNGEIVGSARSIPQFNVVEAISCFPEYLSRFGGHSQAAGFTLKSNDKLKDFEKKLKEKANKELQGVDLAPEIDIDCEIKLNEVNWSLFESLEQLEPFGEGNSEPVFLIRNVEIQEVRGVGQDNKHLRLRIKQSVKSINVIGFYFGNTDDNTINWCDELNVGDLADVVVCVSVNEWNGNRELQLRLVDIKLSN